MIIVSGFTYNLRKSPLSVDLATTWKSKAVSAVGEWMWGVFARSPSFSPWRMFKRF